MNDQSLWDQMSKRDRINTLQNMRWNGGGFAGHLAEAWMVADSVNSLRLAEAFPDLVEKYQPKNWVTINEK